MKRAKSVIPAVRSPVSARLLYGFGAIILICAILVTSVAVIGIGNLLLGWEKYRQARLPFVLALANEYCAITGTGIDRFLTDNSEGRRQEFPVVPKSVRARNDLQDASLEFLNILRSFELELLLRSSPQGTRRLVTYVPEGERWHHLREGDAGYFIEEALETNPIEALFGAAELLASVYPSPVFSHTHRLLNNLDELEQLSMAGNCEWSVSAMERPNIFSLLGDIFLVAADMRNFGPYWHYDWITAYRRIYAWNGGYIFSFSNVSFPIELANSGWSVVMPVHAGYPALLNAIGMILGGWVVGMAVLGMAVVWWVFRPLRVLGRASMAAGNIVREQENVPAKLQELSDTLSKWPIAVGEYKGLLQDLSALLHEREVWLDEMLHDLKNEFQTVVLGLGDVRNFPGNLNRALPDMEKATGRIRDMLNNVAIYQWTQFGKPEEAGLIDLGSLVETIIDDIADAGGDAVSAGHEEITVVARREALQKALQNLFWNAHHHGGAIAVWLGVHEELEAVEILIDDDGPGIPDDQMEELFKPYRRGNPDKRSSGGFVGAGLGLTIARRVVSDHGGEISIENRRSEDGGIEGLRVRVVLPLKGP